MTKVYKKEKFVAGTPGQTFVMQSGKLEAIEPGTAFLAAAPRDPWPSRGRGAAGEPPDYTPATGRRELDADDLARLAATLTELAGSPVGGPLFKGLFSLPTSERAERTPTFASVARSGEDRHVFEYVPTRCAFAPAHTDGTNPRTAYLAGAGVLGPRSARCARRRARPDRLDLRPRPAVERVAAAFCVSTSSGSSTG